MRIVIVCVLIIVIGASCGARQQKTEAVNSLMPEGLTPQQADSVYSKLKQVYNNTQVAIALIDKGVVHFYGVVKERDTLKTARIQNRFFEIGSITKVFTSTILAGYVAAGTLNVKDKINPHLQVKLKDGLELTFEQLANHTSGLSRLPSNMTMAALLNPANPYSDYDNEKLNQYLTESLKLETQPGTKVSYSNLGVGLLGYTLSQYSGLSYEELARKVFDTYSMKQSTTMRSNIKDVLVEGRGALGGATSNWDLNALVAAGGVYSSVAELSQFVLAHFDSTNTVLALTRMPTVADTDKRSVGLGWFILKRETGHVWYWHNGGTGGYTSSMVFDPDKKNGVIVLSNISALSQASGLADKLSFALMKTID